MVIFLFKVIFVLDGVDVKFDVIMFGGTVIEEAVEELFMTELFGLTSDMS